MVKRVHDGGGIEMISNRLAGLSCETCGHYDNHNEGLKEKKEFWYDEIKCECSCHVEESE